MDSLRETSDSDKIIAQAKARLEHYVNLNSDPNRYPQLNDRQRKGFATGTKEEREMLEAYDKQNPYQMNKISGVLGIAEVLLQGKEGQAETIQEIQKLSNELISSGVNKGRPVTKEQVLKIQDLLRQTLELSVEIHEF